ncbi:TVP38/TMEM64 family protein [Aquibium sp. ELW1220]|uniref:TVP38/TMEM64 family protein n=1 Tax=Aquibium sp. ELW1220 TaxID=2976766 RepID=UPI0025B2149E|nr:TVP38/TMEM64 family protein [Aquibium sp. ELW1220]MDN2578575.1 TVP38/TMEM64 family protein [Aquibium sp. ELW1220]
MNRGMTMADKALPATEKGGGRSFLRFLPLVVIVFGLCLGYAMGWHRFLSLSYLAESRADLGTFIQGNYALALAGFFLAYALATAFSFPAASVLTIVAGLFFGWLVAGIVVAFAATLGATALFLAARSAFGDVLHRRLGDRVARLADGFEKDAFGYLLVLRLAPIFPFWVINIAPALFSVPVRTYVSATFIGILPGTFAYAYLGTGLDSVLDAARESGRDISIGDLVTPQITIAFAALALVAAIPTAIRAYRNRAAG